jgi:hypothetical protein
MRSWSKGAKAASFVFGGIATVWGFYVDTDNSSYEWIFKLALIGAGVLFISFPIFSFGKHCIKTIHQLRSAVEKSRQLGAAESRALEWQLRAQKAELRLNDWNAETLLEGRARAVGELVAASSSTTFGATELLDLGDGNILLAAEILSGRVPVPRAVYFIEGELTHDVKAVVECVRQMSASAVEFRLKYYGSVAREDFLELTKTKGALPKAFRIVAREQTDDFYNER